MAPGPYSPKQVTDARPKAERKSLATSARLDSNQRPLPSHGSALSPLSYERKCVLRGYSIVKERKRATLADRPRSGATSVTEQGLSSGRASGRGGWWRDL